MQDMTTLHNRFRATGIISTESGMRIGAGRSADLLGSDLPIVRDAQGLPYIPGASLKGVFRTQAEQIVNAFQNAVTDPTEVMDKDKEIRKILEKEKDGTQKFNIVVRETHEIVTLFGSTLIAGRIFFRDAMVVPGTFSYVEPRNGVKINRETGSQQGSALYNYDTVPAGVNFSFELFVENATETQLGLVLLILDSWRQNGFQVGGFTRRGLGWMRLNEYNDSFHEVKKPQDLINLLQGTKQAMNNEQRAHYISALSNSLASSAGA